MNTDAVISDQLPTTTTRDSIPEEAAESTSLLAAYLQEVSTMLDDTWTEMPSTSVSGGTFSIDEDATASASVTPITEAPESSPESSSEPSPESTPESTPEATPEATSEASSEASSEATSESIPESTPVIAATMEPADNCTSPGYNDFWSSNLTTLGCTTNSHSLYRLPVFYYTRNLNVA
jgi:hypothetical protein